MNGLRDSFFNRFYKKCEQNKITSDVLQLGVKTGVADLVYRNFSKEYLKNRREFFDKNKQRIEKNIEILEDDISKNIYKNMIYYRSHRKRDRFPKSIAENVIYFPKEIINLSDNEVFIDCGSYDGDTINDFVKKANNKYKSIIAFEPDENNYKQLQKNIEKYKNVKLYNYGVWDKKETLKFNENGDVGSNISEIGNTEIKVTDLESIQECKNATFIKMDIEGAELNALKGAENIIKENKPKLAICIYHSDNDMIDIIEYIHKLVPEYKIYIRHHSFIEADTVMYCIKR